MAKISRLLSFKSAKGTRNTNGLIVGPTSKWHRPAPHPKTQPKAHPGFPQKPHTRQNLLPKSIILKNNT